MQIYCMKETLPQVMLAGLESAGKSALFRGLTGHATGDEANYRGSTVTCRRCRLNDCQCEVVDTPGIRTHADAQTTRAALTVMREADVVLLVVRGTHAVSEVETLLCELDLAQKRTALVITFRDKAPQQVKDLAKLYRENLQIPVVIVNARELDVQARSRVLQAISDAARIEASSPRADIDQIPVVQPPVTWFEHRFFGPCLSLVVMTLMFAVPVFAAYEFAMWAQPLGDEMLITPLKTAATLFPPLMEKILTGSYGVVTLGWYSFLWAFPVVLLMSLSVALTEDTGLKDRITAALDPLLRCVGLNGRDLIPVLTGYGCNVVAVFQSRSCSACTRKSCVSLIAFGSACSYQIGASLSIFSSAGHPGLFIPYLGMLFVVGALHTRLWQRGTAPQTSLPLHERSFLQRPSWRALGWRMKAALGQFLKQAMPIFLLICIIAALLEHSGVTRWLAEAVAPALGLLHLPGETAPAIVLSVLRKDGLLVLNSGEGALLASMTAGQVFLLVWLASTFTACLVTLWTVRRELGWRTAAHIGGRQAVTSLFSSWIISLLA
jgi:ferrous iron transport protein B